MTSPVLFNTTINTEHVAKLSATAFITHGQSTFQNSQPRVLFPDRSQKIAFFATNPGWVLKYKIATLENFLIIFKLHFKCFSGLPVECIGELTNIALLTLKMSGVEAVNNTLDNQKPTIPVVDIIRCFNEIILCLVRTFTNVRDHHHSIDHTEGELLNFSYHGVLDLQITLTTLQS